MTLVINSKAAYEYYLMRLEQMMDEVKHQRNKYHPYSFRWTYLNQEHQVIIKRYNQTIERYPNYEEPSQQEAIVEASD